jgi:hypothetical protein
MEHESLEFKIVMDDGKDAEVLARLAALDIASAAYMAAIAKYPQRNVYLRQGASIIKQNLGEPQPELPPDPNARSWSAHLIGGKKLTFLGFVGDVDEPTAIEQAVVVFSLEDERRKRLAVNLRRHGVRQFGVSTPSDRAAALKKAVCCS